MHNIGQQTSTATVADQNLYFWYQLFHLSERQLPKCLTQQIARYVEIWADSAPALLSTKHIQGLPELVLQNNWGNSQEKETYLFPPGGIKQLQYYNISMFLHNSKEDSWLPKFGSLYVVLANELGNIKNSLRKEYIE